MADQVEQIELVEPYNPTDAVVVFDPEMEFSNIVINYNDEPEDRQVEGTQTVSTDAKKEDAIRYPLIKINNNVIARAKLKKFEMQIKEFLPTVDIEVDDSNHMLQNTDSPGMNNVITVIITAPDDTASKKISLDFYITDCDFDRNVAIYKGEFKLIDLKKEVNEQIGDDQLTTYETFETIAKQCKLGFAATENCKDIDDKRWRHIYSMSYKKYIEDMLTYAGVDEESVLDAWIDQYGYLVLVNLPWIIHQDVNPLQLTIKTIAGEQGADFGKTEENTITEINRMISNTNNANGVNNLMFERFEMVSNNSNIVDKGSLRTLYWLGNPGIINSIEMKQIQIIENSVDGKTGSDEYEYDKIEYMGVEMEETPLLIQREIRNSFIDKFTTKQLYIELKKPNHNLQRGMLIMVTIYEYEGTMKKMLIANMDNPQKTEVEGEPEDNLEETDGAEAQNDSVLNEGDGIANTSLCGLYYILWVGYKWEQTNNDIIQYMYLVKKDQTTNVTNKYAPAKV